MDMQKETYTVIQQRHAQVYYFCVPIDEDCIIKTTRTLFLF